MEVIMIVIGFMGDAIHLPYHLEFTTLTFEKAVLVAADTEITAAAMNPNNLPVFAGGAVLGGLVSPADEPFE
jgi:hypothetical protein